MFYVRKDGRDKARAEWELIYFLEEYVGVRLRVQCTDINWIAILQCDGVLDMSAIKCVFFYHLSFSFSCLFLLLLRESKYSVLWGNLP